MNIAIYVCFLLLQIYLLNADNCYLYNDCICTFNKQASDKIENVNCRKQLLVQLPKRNESSYAANLINLIDFSTNYIQHIPDDYFRGLYVNTLDLSNNQINRISKNVFRDIARLITLNINDNNLKEISNDAFKPLRDFLINLTLSANKLEISEGLNDALSMLQDIEYLDLSKNQLIRVPNLNSLMHLRVLSLSHNLIETLEIMDVNFESSSVTSFPSGLNELYLNNNRLKQINQNWLSNLRHLKALDLSSNQISFINKEAFNNLNELQRLILSENSFNRIPSEIFVKLSHLRYLDLSRQSRPIATIENYAFDREDPISKLETVFLFSNRILNISNLAFCSKFGANNIRHVTISHLNLNENQIVNANPCIFKQLNANKENNAHILLFLETFSDNNKNKMVSELPLLDCTDCASISYLTGYNIETRLTCKRVNYDNRSGTLMCEIKPMIDICDKHHEFDCYRIDNKAAPIQSGTHVLKSNVEIIVYGLFKILIIGLFICF